MKIREFERSFSESELVHGAEMYFAGDLKNLTIQDPDPKNSCASVKACVDEWNPLGEKELRNCELSFSEKKGIVIGTYCSCDEFRRDSYGCRHVAALLTAYHASKSGNEIFHGTKLEQQLKNLTMVEDPFQPGAIKRTDDRLAGFLKDCADESLPVWKNGEKHEKTEILRSESSVSVHGGKVLLEIKLGTSRVYVIKNLPELLTAYREEKTYTLGKNEYVISRSVCDEKTANLLDLLSESAGITVGGKIPKGLFECDMQKYPRYFMLRGKALDRYMELSDGSRLNTGPTGELRVALSYKGLAAVLKKSTYGATLKIENRTVLFRSDNYSYFSDGETLFRIPSQTPTMQKQFENLLSLKESLYIREADILSVCRSVLPIFEKYGTVTVKGLDPEDYEKEKPKFRFFLDYNKESGLLTCRAAAIYESSGKEYVLFGDADDVSKRNGAEESRTGNAIRQFFDSFDPKSGILSKELDEQETFLFLKDRLHDMEKLGEVMGTDAFRKLRIRRLPAISVGISVNNGGLMMSLAGAGMTPEEMDEVLSSYSRKRNFFRLKSGAFVTLDGEDNTAWETCAEIYRHYGRKDPEAMKLPLYRALYLKEMLENRDDAVVSEEDGFRKLCEKMDPEKWKNVKVPGSLSSVLRPYQSEGFRWISILKHCGFGGILADDMGLGKTLQIIAFILAEKQAGKRGDRLRTLVVCPASLIYNWEKEIGKYAPELTCVCIAGNAAARAKLIEEERDKDVWITSYDLLKRDIHLYEDIVFATEVVDEAQFIKNQTTQAAQSVRVIKSSFRMALTGTPIENHLSELWSIMDYLMPGFLYGYTQFQKDFEVPITASDDQETLSRLRKLTHPFILRRLKKQVLKELPEKLEETVTVRMEDEQRRIYDALANEIRMSLQKTSDTEFRTGKLQFLSQLTKLREVCCDPSLLYDNYKGGSAKLDACMQLVREATGGGHKVLLFSQFTSMLDRICGKLTENEISFHRIDGSVNKEKRMEMVESFANDDVPVFCISLKAGGTGLNLTAADIVIHYDPWWNKAAQDQATDRTHRIGQNRVVSVYELIAENSVEEQIQTIKSGKQKLADDILSGEGIASASITKEDMLSLLSVK